MEIIKNLDPGIRKYRFTHYDCCEFTAHSNEFKWVTGQYNETTASVICPKCGKKFYYHPEEIKPEEPSFDNWPNAINCLRNCKKCQAKCLYRKEPYLCLY